MHTKLIGWLRQLWEDERGTVTVATHYNAGTYEEQYNITKSSTANAAATFAHGLGVNPNTGPHRIVFTPLLAAAYHSQWRVQQTLTTANTVSLVATSTANSAGATAQVRVTLHLTHTIVR